MKSFTCTLAVALAGVSSVAAAQATPALAPRLDSVARSWIATDHNTGAVVAVVRDRDTLLFRSYGNADVEANAPMPLDAVFGIGSVTKQFTAAAILQLRDAQKLGLDDDITKWLPDFDTRGNTISLRMMLGHTAGIADVDQVQGLRPFLRDPALSRDSMYALVKLAPSRFAPGTAQIYSNTAYWLLHLVVEKASGMPYDQYLATKIFQPLGMKSSGFCLSAEAYPRRATGYGVRRGNFRRAPLNTTTLYLGSGVLCSSAADMLTWLTSLHGGKVLSPASYKEMITPTKLADGSVTRYAMGLEVGRDSHGLEVIGHSGELTGYTARANWYPAAKLAVVVLINNSGDASPSAMAEDLAAVVAPVAPRPVRPFTGDVASLVGTYKGMGRGGDMTIVVAPAANGLSVSIDGSPSRAVSWVEALTFDDRGDVLTFRKDPAGTVTALGYDVGGGYFVLRKDKP